VTDGASNHRTPPIVPPDWVALQPLLDRLLDAPAAERPSLLEALSAGDAARRDELAHLLAACERGLPLLDSSAAERFDALLADTDADDPILPELLGDRYRVGRELGRGGMARVYLARDTKHGRDVAIKVIRPELSASLGHDRFLREIDIAARLRHPNIVPLYDSGNAGGVLYFVMPFENGPSLRDRLKSEGALPLQDALGILRDVARALGYAHANGVVHRDVKPDNVMLSGGAAVVTDFGIAKALSAALTEGGAPSITQTGSGIGTPAYMAPEQAMGDPATDHRADIYSYGCLAYELLTGKPPFVEPSVHLVVAAHMTRPPRPIAELRPEVPPAITDIVARCLAKAPGDRPQGVGEILAVLDGPATQPASPRTSSESSTPEPGAGPSRAGRRVRLTALVLLLIAAGAYFLPREGTAPAAPITVAVLPFGNSAADSSIEFVVEGLGDEVAASLVHIPGIAIKSRAGARMFRGQLGVDVAEAGAKLKADYLMTGVVRQDRGQWILSADLARASDGTSIWTDKFTLNSDQQAGAVDMITRSLLSALRAQFPGTIGAATASAATGMTTNSEAYRLYLRGQEGLSRRGLSVKASADMFREAIREDSTFARAYSGLSMALALFPYFQDVPAREINDELVRTARRALELAPELAQPHVTLAMAHQFAFRWDSAEAEFRLAIDRDPRDVEARVQFARHLLFRGRHDEALQQLRVARSEDPASALVLSWMSYAYYLDGQQDSALVEGRRALDNDSLNFTSLSLGALVLMKSGRFAQAERLTTRLSARTPLKPYVLAKAGHQDEVRRQLASVDSTGTPSWQVDSWRGYAYLGLGDTLRAIDALERSLDRGEIWPILHTYDDPIFLPLRRTPRYAALMERIGLGAALAATNARR